MSGGSRPGGSTRSWLPSSASSQAPPPAPETLTRSSGVPAGRALTGRRERPRQPALEQLRQRDVGRGAIPALGASDASASICSLWPALARPGGTILRGPRCVRALALVVESLRRERRWRCERRSLHGGVSGVAAAGGAAGAGPGQRSRAAADPRPLHHDGARAGDADATAVQLNPGALGFLPAAGLELVGADASDPAVVPRRGFGAYLGLPIFLRSSLGLRPLPGHRRQRGGDRRAHHVAARLRAALPAQRLARRLLGAHLGRLLRRRRHLRLRVLGAGRPLRGARRRPSRTSASRTRTPSARRCRGSGRRSWLLRPLGTDRLEVALGAAHADGDGWDRLVPRARISATLDRRPPSLRRGGERPARDRRDLRRRQRHAARASGWRSTSIISARRGRRPDLHPGRRRRRRGDRGAHPPRRRAAPGAGGAGLRRARAAARGSTTIAHFFQAGPPAARAGGRSGRGRRAVQDRGRQPRLRPHRGAARSGGAPARARQADVRLPDLPVDARVLPGRRLRRHPGSPRGRAVGDRRRHRTSPSTRAPWTGSASTWSWCASARSRGRWSRSS